MYYFVMKQFSHGAPNYHYIWYIFSLKTTFYRDARDKKKPSVFNLLLGEKAGLFKTH